ncbi:MAG TPA: GNAT family N-acetyltransferase [Candidatus Avipropionibacterium avicola]|uniref:GNAT family N-acetyltransferase n=1 Tax=Candidatus Avipropionibacterium avicola TaxID=2840701 RepID=A0A9D1GYU5_9ACTN|nr:GNAT family N-acetyltransferase [Candidatus Avipropionibacterium avicola]
MRRAWGTVDTRWPVTLTEGPVVLRPLQRRDEAEWRRIRAMNKAWLTPWDATLPPGGGAGPANFREMVRAFDQQARQGRMLPWAVCWDAAADPETPDDVRRRAPEVAGQVTVSGLVGGSAAMGSIGYWIDERFAGKGIIPTAVAMATDYCFEVVGLHRIEIAIRPENAKSLRVVDKLGFRSEGMRPRYLHINGDWRDHLIFALNAEEVPGGLLARWRSSRDGSQEPNQRTDRGTHRD